jgi:hypothetical protein
MRRWTMAGAGAVLAIAAAVPAVAEPVATGSPVATEGARPAAVRRVPKRVRIYSAYPGPNATRQCEAHYVQEFRPSGTVIVPRMHCWWVPG